MDTIAEKQSKIGKDNEELGLPLKQTDTDYHNADGDTVATDEEVKQVSKLFLARNQDAYTRLAME